MQKSIRQSIIAYLIAFASMALVTTIFLPVRALLGNATAVALVQIFIVVLVAIRWGLGPSLAAAVSGMITFNFFFLPPYYTFTISGYDDIVLYLAFIAISLAVGKLSAQAKNRADTAETQLREIKRLNAELQQEIHVRKRVEQELRVNQRLLHAIIETASAVVYVRDIKGCYLLINRRYEELFHVKREEVIGKTDHDLWSKEIADQFHAFDEQVLAAGTAIEGEEMAPHDDGMHTYLSIKAPLFDDAKNAYAVWGISTDITKQKRAEQEVRRLNTELEQKIVQLQEAQEELVRKEKLAILGQLSGSIGHELRNPLGVMSNAVYFLKMVLTETDETVQEYLGIIKKEIDESLRIITDLLDFARTKPPQIKTVTARALIDETLGRCTVPATVELHDEVPQTLPPLTIDPLQIGQVLQNLIMNAVQAMPAGGTITLRGRPDSEGTVRLEVADTGEGISPENMKKLFQPLFTTKPKGIGLGLVVCRNLTEAGGGRIEVASTVGKGTTFMVVLPVEA